MPTMIPKKPIFRELSSIGLIVLPSNMRRDLMYSIKSNIFFATRQYFHVLLPFEKRFYRIDDGSSE